MGFSPEFLAKSGTEHGEQAALICWAKRKSLYHQELELLHAVPNGGKRDRITAGQMKAEGVLPGVFDLFLPIARKGFHGLYIEMKVKDGGVVSLQQKWWGKSVTREGYAAYVCNGWEVARDCIADYLGIDNSYPAVPKVNGKVAKQRPTSDLKLPGF